MTSEELSELLRAGADEAAALERTLIDGYHVAIMAAARRSARLFSKHATVVAAAGPPGWFPPEKSQIVDVDAARQVQSRRTEKRRAQMAAAALSPSAAETGASDQRVSEAVGAVLTALAPLADSVAEAIAEPVESAIREGFAEGWSVPRTANAIVEKVGEMAAWKAEMLARTDLVAISNLSSIENVRMVNAAARDQGQPTFEFKRWIATDDELTRETHAEAHGQVVPIGDAFRVGGGLLQYPGDPSGPPDETINCRCTQVYEEAPAAALAASADDSEETMSAIEHDTMTAATFTRKERERLAEEGVAMGDGSFPIRNRADLENALSAIGRASDYDAAKRHIIKRARALDAVALLPEEWKVKASAEERSSGEADEPEEATTVLTAAALGMAPLKPSKEWFLTPEAATLTPLTVTADGQVYGHAASRTCHRGFRDRCINPPYSRTNYAAFHTGEIETLEGDRIAVGRITVGGGHSRTSGQAAARASREHYDDADSVAAFVRVTEGVHGPWVAGAVRSDLPAEKLRDFRANPPSGEWLDDELVALHCVPVSGFLVPRPQQLAASGEEADGEEYVPSYLAASAAALGMAPQEDCGCEDETMSAEEFSARTDALAALAGVSE